MATLSGAGSRYPAAVAEVGGEEDAEGRAGEGQASGKSRELGESGDRVPQVLDPLDAGGHRGHNGDGSVSGHEKFPVGGHQSCDYGKP